MDIDEYNFGIYYSMLLLILYGFPKSIQGRKCSTSQLGNYPFVAAKGPYTGSMSTTHWGTEAGLALPGKACLGGGLD